MVSTSLHFILNTFRNKTYSLLSGQHSHAIQGVTTRSYGLDRLDGTMTDPQTIHTLRSVYIPCRLTCIQSHVISMNGY